MGLEYRDYQEKIKTEVIGKLKTGLEKIGMLETAIDKISEEDEIKISQLKDALQYNQNDSPEAVKLLERQLEQAKQNAANNANEDQDIDREHIVKFFEDMDERLKKDDSLEELGQIEKEISVFERKFASKRKSQLIMARSFEFKKNLEESERKEKVTAAIGIVRKSCQKYRDYINRMRMSKKFKRVTGRQGPMHIYDITGLKEAVKTCDFAFLLPFLGGKEPLIIRMHDDRRTGAKEFSFDRSFAIKITGVHLDVVVAKLYKFFEKEIAAGHYMQLDFSDKKDLSRICEELAKRNVKLDLEKMDLPNEDKYKLVGIYIENLRKDERYTFAARPNPDTNKQEDFISKGELKKMCARLKITPKLQEYIWDKHRVRISGGTELTPDQENSSTAEVTMPDFANNPSEDSQVVNNTHI